MFKQSEREKPPALGSNSNDQSAEATRARAKIHADQLLDEALADSFPASDPVSTLEYDVPSKTSDGGQH